MIGSILRKSWIQKRFRYVSLVAMVSGDFKFLNSPENPECQSMYVLMMSVHSSDRGGGGGGSILVFCVMNHMVTKFSRCAFRLQIDVTMREKS